MSDRCFWLVQRLTGVQLLEPHTDFDADQLSMLAHKTTFARCLPGLLVPGHFRCSDGWP